MKFITKRFAMLAAVFLCVCSSPKEEKAKGRYKSHAKHLAIIGDDIGIDVTKQHVSGPDRQPYQAIRAFRGIIIPNYRQIRWPPASTPTLNRLARAGMRFTQAWMQPFCSPTRHRFSPGFIPLRREYWITRTGWSQNHHSFVRDLEGKRVATTPRYSASITWPALALYPGMKTQRGRFAISSWAISMAASATYWECGLSYPGTAPTLRQVAHRRSAPLDPCPASATDHLNAPV